jgi:L-aminopeptidase/D-esterase-like protein
MGRGGTPSGNDSGDIFLAFSTANDQDPAAPLRHFAALAEGEMNALFQATVECVEEAVLNALLAAETMIGKAGRVVEAIDPARLKELIDRNPA